MRVNVGKQFKAKFALGILLSLLSTTTLALSGCQSSVADEVTTTHGANAGNGYTYGSGPNKTKPYPQTEPVSLNGIGGATPKYEPVSRGGNKDYSVLGQDYMVWTDCNSYQEIGTASWYGPGFHGNKTSNGEVYNQKGYSAAHKNLPLPSYLKVTNLENGRAIIVRVNDRGPFHGSRIIDLSEGAAKALNMTQKGTAKVKLELIDMRSGGEQYAQNTQDAASLAPNYQINYAIPSGRAYVQFFSSTSQAGAARIQAELNHKTPYPIIVASEEGLYRVRIGPIPENDLVPSLEYMKQLGYPDSFIKRL